MKKLLLFITLLITSMFTYSQTYLLQEFFNDSVNFPPPNWTMIDADGDGHNWRINTWGGGPVYEIYAVSDSWLSGGIGPLTPENYLVTPQINLTGLSGTVKVRYTVQVADETYFAEKYKVAVSTTGNQTANFTNIPFTETLTFNEYYVWRERIVDLTQFIGQSIYLTWCHFDCYDQYKLLLDSIQVYNEPGVGIAENSAVKVQVYPNPASRNLLVNGDFTDARLVLCKADGRTVYTSENENLRAEIDVSGLERGLYLLRIETIKGVVTRKVALTN